MKTIKQIFALTLLSFLFTACGKDDGSNGGTSITLPTVTTSPAENVNVLSVRLGGALNSTGGSSVFNHGVCGSLNHNPTTADYVAGGGSRDVGPFSFDVTVAEANKTYYARAFAENEKGIAYGDEISFSSAYGITSLPVTNIVTNAALFRGNTAATSGFSITSRGFCYKTTPNPSVSDSYVTTSGGTGDFTIPVTGLTQNTTYYAKPFYNTSNGTTIYGEEINFKTVGYFGPAACYVVYDKGEFTDGWRYLEVSPIGIDYNSSFSPVAKWGCTSTFLSLTYPEIGTGPANTQRIVATCASANCAARLCDNYVHNGFSDWFLLSKDEMLLTSKCFESLAIYTEDAWTSTENTADYAYGNFYSSSLSAYSNSPEYKDGERYVYPARRY